MIRLHNALYEKENPNKLLHHQEEEEAAGKVHFWITSPGYSTVALWYCNYSNFNNKDQSVQFHLLYEKQEEIRLVFLSFHFKLEIIE